MMPATIPMTVSVYSLIIGLRFGRRLFGPVLGVLVCHEGMLGSELYERCRTDSATNIVQMRRVCNDTARNTPATHMGEEHSRLCLRDY
jgi:hypothetical protein